MLRWPVLLLLLPLTLSAREIEEGSRGRPDFQARLYGLTSRRSADSTQDLVMSPRSPGRALLALRFDQEVPGLLRDDAGNYNVRANYVRADQGPSGPCAQFVKPDNRIELSSPPELWPGRGEVDDFTIQFWIKPVIFYRQSIVLKKMGMLGGERRGLEIRLDSGRVQAAFIRLLAEEDGQLSSTTLSAAGPLSNAKWTHIALTWERAKGRLALYVDNREQMVRILPPTQSIVFHPHDRSPIVVGESFFGSLDEVIIYDHAINPEYNRSAVLPAAHISDGYRITQQRAMAVSKVYETPLTSEARFRYQAQEPPGSLIAFYVRASMSPFREDAPDRDELAWKRIYQSTDKLPRFRFFQWKAVFQASPRGDASPVLESVTLAYHPAMAPMRPGSLRIVQELSGPDTVCLEWRKNPEPEVNEQGRYVIYYGQTPSELTGRILTVDGKPVRAVPFEKMLLTPDEKRQLTYREAALRRDLSGRIRVLINNRTISENVAAHPRKKDMPFLEADRAYYFGVSAISPNGESEMSREAVTVLRPPADLAAED